MSSAIQQLMSFKDTADPFNHATKDVLGLQVKAAQEYFAEKREQVPVLERRAKETDTVKIQKLEDIVPVLLAHTTYKSYPLSFIKKGQWDRMLQWLGMVAAGNYENVDVSGVKDIDDFLDRLWASGTAIFTSSGTSGKVSLMARNKHDCDLFKEFVLRFRGWPNSVEPKNQYHMFLFGAIKGTYAATYSGEVIFNGFGRPDSRYLLIEDRMRTAQIMEMAEMRARMAAGTATPAEIAKFEAEGDQRSDAFERRFEFMVDKLIELRHEQVWIQGMLGQIWEVIERMKAKGIKDGDFSPKLFLSAGGGRKHLKLPDDFQKQVGRFFGTKGGVGGYGMSEMAWLYPTCEAGRYHAYPWLIPLLLDRNSEKLLNTNEGIVEGRFAFLDVSAQERWGGLITGDKVNIDFSGSCPCGRKSLNVLPNISRYSEETGDDKIECSGTIDAYIRGRFAASA